MYEAAPSPTQPHAPVGAPNRRLEDPVPGALSRGHLFLPLRRIVSAAGRSDRTNLSELKGRRRTMVGTRFIALRTAALLVSVSLASLLAISASGPGAESASAQGTV